MSSGWEIYGLQHLPWYSYIISINRVKKIRYYSDRHATSWLKLSNSFKQDSSAKHSWCKICNLSFNVLPQMAILSLKFCSAPLINEWNTDTAYLFHTGHHCIQVDSCRSEHRLFLHKNHHSSKHHQNRSEHLQ